MTNIPSNNRDEFRLNADEPVRVVHMTPEEIAEEQASFMTSVYGWMAMALTITGIVAMWVAMTPAVLDIIFSSRIFFYVLIFAEFGLVGYLSARVNKMSAATATGAFIGYSVLNGLTLSVIFLVYTTSSIASTFFITAGTFAVMSAIGYFTKKDLTSMGRIAFMGLIGIIIASVVNWFMHSETMYWLITYGGVLIFTVLTAYDTQKIKNLNVIGNAGTEEDRKEAIMGALTLYLDFINLFLFLLRALGSRK